MSQWCFLLARTAAGVRRTVPFTVADDAAKGGLVPLTRSPARVGQVRRDGERGGGGAVSDYPQNGFLRRAPPSSST